MTLLDLVEGESLTQYTWILSAQLTDATVNWAPNQKKYKQIIVKCKSSLVNPKAICKSCVK